MDINLESRNLRRRHQQYPVSGWSREPVEHNVDPPVRIRTLGRFTIGVRTHPLAQTFEHHQKPFELLQMLIALGGRGVHSETLAASLWPDADGDKAQNAYDVTLHRLRRLFELKEVLLLHDHRLTLNSRLVWVDAWAFERTINHSERLLARSDDLTALGQLSRYSERLLNFYQGAFLEREAVRPWMLSLRERLRSKLLRHILDVGLVREKRNEWAQAIRLYQKGLEIEPVGETLYQRLILCYRDTGKLAEALSIFHQCRKQLTEQLQIQPSARTFALYQSLRVRPTAS